MIFATFALGCGDNAFLDVNVVVDADVDVVVDVNVDADADASSQLDADVTPDSSDAAVPIDPTIVCYPGENFDYTLCFPTVAESELVDPAGEYVYDGSNGDSQYRPPVRFLDLAAIDPDTLLSLHFAVWEFAEEIDGRYAVIAPSLIERLEALRAEYDVPVYITSGFRSPAHNAAVGGVQWSRHMYGDAVDMYSDDVSLNDLELACLMHSAAYTDIYDDGHLHCDWRDDPLNSVFFTDAP